MDSIISIQNLIYTIRGQRIMLDSDLAILYEVETKVLNQAIKRNIERFPSDFMFQLNYDEWQILRLQFVTSKKLLKNVAEGSIYPTFLLNRVLQCYLEF